MAKKKLRIYYMDLKQRINPLIKKAMILEQHFFIQTANLRLCINAQVSTGFCPDI